MSRPFLTAEWLGVLGVTYAVDAARLEPHLPRGAQIDTLEGSPRVSIVAFRFRRTRLRGVPIPLHVNFGEINLRFYVRLEGGAPSSSSASSWRGRRSRSSRS